MSKHQESFFVTTLALLLVYGIAFAAADEGYYKGKTVRFVVAFSAGGGFDTYTRVIGRHFGKHIPGNPSVIVENMPGAGGFIQSNYMFQAKPDGLTVGNNIGGLILQQIMGAKGANFDGKRFEYIDKLLYEIQSWEKGFEVHREYYQHLRQSKDYDEGSAAFSQRRKPEFTQEYYDKKNKPPGVP